MTLDIKQKLSFFSTSGQRKNTKGVLATIIESIIDHNKKSPVETHTVPTPLLLK